MIINQKIYMEGEQHGNLFKAPPLTTLKCTNKGGLVWLLSFQNDR